MEKKLYRSLDHDYLLNFKSSLEDKIEIFRFSISYFDLILKIVLSIPKGKE